MVPWGKEAREKMGMGDGLKGGTAGREGVDWWSLDLTPQLTVFDNFSCMRSSSSDPFCPNNCLIIAH